MINRRYIIALLSVFVVMSAWAVYIHQTYFFNPLTFRRDAVTYLSYRWYTHPLFLEYESVEPDGIHTYVSMDEREVATVFRELKRGQTVSYVAQPNASFADVGAQYIFIRELPNNYPKDWGTILLQVRIDPGESVGVLAHLSGPANVVTGTQPNGIKLTQSLQSLLNQRKAQATLRVPH